MIQQQNYLPDERKLAAIQRQNYLIGQSLQRKLRADQNKRDHIFTNDTPPCRLRGRNVIRY